MSKQLHSKMGIKDRLKEKTKKKVIHLCMLQNEAYKKSMTTRAYQGYGILFTYCCILFELLRIHLSVYVFDKHS